MSKLLFTKQNYFIMLAGVALIFLGLIIILMDKEKYGFGFFGLTLGPLVMMAGFIVEFFAIFFKSKKA